MKVRGRCKYGQHMSTNTVPSASERPTLTVEEAGKLLGLSRGTAYQAVRCGDIPARRIGGRWIVPTAAVRRLLDLDEHA